MKLSFGQHLAQKQTQKLAPRMIQSMEILQMPLAQLEERIEQERGQDRSPERIAMLEEMAQAYYTEMRNRMESFFAEKKPAQKYS